jgi:flagellar assembly factor FliW
MSVRIESVRFGALELPEDQLLDFPRGLIGIPGRGYVLVNPDPDSAFCWLHSTENGAFALPLVSPFVVVPTFALSIDPTDRERIGLEDLSKAAVYVTVNAAPDPAKTTVNLRAPVIIWERRGYQVLNNAPGADLRAPLLPAPVASAAESTG